MKIFLSTNWSKTAASQEAAHLSDAKQRLLSNCLRGAATLNSPDSERIPRRAASEFVRMTLAQEQIWRRTLRARESPAIHNESITIHRNGPLDVSVLRRCFAEILRRHEAWRTTFAITNDIPVQIVDPAPGSPEIPFFDLQFLSAELRETEGTRLVSAMAQEPFDLARGPLLRPCLLRMDDERYRFTVIAHQSILDGFSAYHIFPAEMAALYAAFSQDKPSPLPELPIQFPDFSVWQRDWFNEARANEQREYWKRQLAGSSLSLDWPGRNGAHVQETYHGAIRPFELPDKLTRALVDLARSESITLFMVLLTGFVALLHSYARQPEIVVATLSPSGRKRPETQLLLGYFLNPVLLKFNRLDEITFRQLLFQARSVVSDVIAHDDIPMESLAEQLGLNTGRDPLVKYAITLQPKSPALGPEWSVTTMDAQNGGSPWDLFLSFIEQRGGLIGRAQYNPDVFQEDTIAVAVRDLAALLERAASNPAANVSDLLQNRARNPGAAAHNSLPPASSSGIETNVCGPELT